MSGSTSLENDIRAIEALNRRDVEAVLSGDTEKMMSQWSENFVVLPPVGPIVRGRSANADIVEKGREQLRAMENVEFVADFEEIKVVENYAFEWGTYRGTSRPRTGGDPVSYCAS
jgi:ketosteroid isomerase-like protein